jgi:hypothetical protein
MASSKFSTQEGKSMNKLMIGTVGLFILAASPVFASSVADSDVQPQARTYNGIPYLSGGFGVDERTTLRGMSKADNLELSFALNNKDYLSGANVLIKDDRGKEILKAVADGPLFFTKLPAGKYTIEATAAGRTEEQVAQVPTTGRSHVYFAWKESKERTQTQGASS